MLFLVRLAFRLIRFALTVVIVLFLIRLIVMSLSLDVAG